MSDKPPTISQISPLGHTTVLPKFQLIYIYVYSAIAIIWIASGKKKTVLKIIRNRAPIVCHFFFFFSKRERFVLTLSKSKKLLFKFYSFSLYSRILIHNTYSSALHLISFSLASVKWLTPNSQILFIIAGFGAIPHFLGVKNKFQFFFVQLNFFLFYSLCDTINT